MLRCKLRYRNIALGMNVEPGEVLRDLDPDFEAWLQRDAPGAFEPVTEKQAAKAPDAPPRDKMLRREHSARKESERAGGEVMTERNMSALVRPKY